MALGFLSGSASSHVKYFDIRLDDDYIVFRGTADEAASAHLRGSLVLCLAEPLTTSKHIRLHLTGMSRVCWHLPTSPSTGSRKPYRERNFFEKTWNFRDAGKGKTETTKAGNYEFPFDIVLPGSLPESVEGLSETWVTYRFKAEIGRKYAKDIIVRKPLRIIRTMDPGALELAHAMSVENVWPNKIEYSISTASKAVIFGTSLRVDFRLVPLLKGLRIGAISTQLIETHDLTLNPEATDTQRASNKFTRVIISDNYEMDEDAEPEILNEESEGYQFSRVLDLPKTLNKCLQDADTCGIKIKHKLKFRVQLHNPDAHISELRATLPVSLFISPHMPLDENHNVIDQTGQAALRATESLAQQAPPLYEEHRFDQLYSELDPNGYMTPRNESVPGTPSGAHSRNLSAENVASMNELTDPNVSYNVLHSRLSDLHVRNRRRDVDAEQPDSAADADVSSRPRSGLGNELLNSRQDSQLTSPAFSRRTSDDHIASGAATPGPQFDEVEDLSRVPSYTTAVRSVPRTTNNNLPDYRTATAGDLAVQSPPRTPRRVHLRGENSRRPVSIGGTPIWPQISQQGRA